MKVTKKSATPLMPQRAAPAGLCAAELSAGLTGLGSAVELSWVLFRRSASSSKSVGRFSSCENIQMIVECFKKTVMIFQFHPPPTAVQ